MIRTTSPSCRGRARSVAGRHTRTQPLAGRKPLVKACAVRGVQRDPSCADERLHGLDTRGSRDRDHERPRDPAARRRRSRTVWRSWRRREIGEQRIGLRPAPPLAVRRPGDMRAAGCRSRCSTRRRRSECSSSFQRLNSTWTAAISVMFLASSIWPTFTLQRPIDSTYPSRLSDASARTLVASGVRGSGA